MFFLHVLGGGGVSTDSTIAAAEQPGSTPAGVAASGGGGTITRPTDTYVDEGISMGGDNKGGLLPPG